MDASKSQASRPQVDNPQVERTRTAILQAAKELLYQYGPDAVTHQRVADTAHVGRATIYRHWPEREALLIDVLNSLNPRPSLLLSHASAFEALSHAMHLLRADLWGGWGPVFATLIGRAEWDEQVRAAKRRIIEQRTTVLTHLVEQGITDGAFPQELHPKSVIDQLMGVLVVRRFVLDEPITDQELDDLLLALLQPYQPLKRT